MLLYVIFRIKQRNQLKVFLSELASVSVHRMLNSTVLLIIILIGGEAKRFPEAR